MALALAARGDRRGSELEQTVDAIAVEAERIAAGQRIVTRLLEERAARDAVPATPPRPVTPHRARRAYELDSTACIAPQLTSE